MIPSSLHAANLIFTPDLMAVPATATLAALAGLGVLSFAGLRRRRA